MTPDPSPAGGAVSPGRLQGLAYLWEWQEGGHQTPSGDGAIESLPRAPSSPYMGQVALVLLAALLAPRTTVATFP